MSNIDKIDDNIHKWTLIDDAPVKMIFFMTLQ